MNIKNNMFAGANQSICSDAVSTINEEVEPIMTEIIAETEISSLEPQIKNFLLNALAIPNSEWPQDKKITIHAEFKAVIVPKKIEISVERK